MHKIIVRLGGFLLVLKNQCIRKLAYVSVSDKKQFPLGHTKLRTPWILFCRPVELAMSACVIDRREEKKLIWNWPSD